MPSTGDASADAAILRVAPFILIPLVVYSRRTQLFHVEYLRRALRRPLHLQLSTYAQGDTTEINNTHLGVANTVLDRWLGAALDNRFRRVLHVIAGKQLVGKTSTTLSHLARQGRRGLYIDLFAVRQPGDVERVLLDAIIAQHSAIGRVLTPLKPVLRTTLPVAVHLPRPLPEKPAIVVDSVENLFRCDKDGNDGSWLLWALLETSRHADVLLLCSDEAARLHLQTKQAMEPFLSLVFCPEPPHSAVARFYATRMPPGWPEARRLRLGLRMAELFRRAPHLGVDMLRAILHGQAPGAAAERTVERAATVVAERLGLERPSAFIDAQRAEELLQDVECALLFALSPSGERVRAAMVQEHDAAARRLMQVGLLRLEMQRDGLPRMRLSQDCAVIWALSSPAPIAAVQALLRVLRRSNDGVRDQLEALANTVEGLLGECLNARLELAAWMRRHMSGDCPTEWPVDWRWAVEGAVGRAPVAPVSATGHTPVGS